MDRQLEFILEGLKGDIHDLRQEFRKQIEGIHGRLGDLSGFKMLALGVIVGVSSVSSVLVTLLTLYLKAK